MSQAWPIGRVVDVPVAAGIEVTLSMLIEHYDLNVFTPPPEAGAEKLTTIACLTTDISEVLPYLNSTLHGALYQRTANALT